MGWGVGGGGRRAGGGNPRSRVRSRVRTLALSPALALTRAHALVHTLPHSRSRAHTLSPSLSRDHSLSHPLTHPLSLFHPLTHPLSLLHPLTHPLSLPPQVLLNKFSERDSQVEKISQMALFPDEALLFDPNSVPIGRYHHDRPLALPKLNLQFLTFHDYLLRAFDLFRLESAYEIREDLCDTIKVKCGGHGSANSCTSTTTPHHPHPHLPAL